MCLHITAFYTVEREGSPSQEGLALRHQKVGRKKKCPSEAPLSFLSVSLLEHPGCDPALGTSFCLCHFYRAAGK